MPKYSFLNQWIISLDILDNISGIKSSKLSIFPYFPAISHINTMLVIFFEVFFYLLSISLTQNISTCTHTHNNTDACVGSSTCDFEPHGNIRGFGGYDAHHVCHRVAFHYREGEGGLLKKQRSCICWHFWFGNPLDMQATSGGFLRTSIVDSFNLRETENGWLCYAVSCDVSVANELLHSSLADLLPETLQK